MAGFCSLDMNYFCTLMMDTFQQTLPPNIIAIRILTSQWTSLEDFLIDFSNQLSYLLATQSRKYAKAEVQSDSVDLRDSYSLDPTQPQYLASYAQSLRQKIITVANAVDDILAASENISLIVLFEATEMLPSPATIPLFAEILNFFASYLSLMVSVIITQNNSVELPFPLTGPGSDKIIFMSPTYQTVSAAKLLDLLFLEIIAPNDHSISLPISFCPDSLLWIRSQFFQNEFSFMQAVTRLDST